MNKNTIISSSLITLTALTGFALVSTHTYADDSVVSNASVTVPVACMMSGTVNTAHNATINPGNYSGTSTDYANGIGKTTLTAYCNDNNGFSIYAIGFTGDEYGTTTLVGQNTNLAINTKVYESTDTTSNWSMKVTKVTDSTQSYNPTNMSITNSFDNWHIVPDTYTQVAQYKATSGSSTTDQGQGALGAKVETTYATYIAPTQAADTYTGKVKYTMVHPYDHATPIVPPSPISQCTTPVPNVTYMQDVTDTNLASVLASMDMNEQYYLRDKRDEIPYCVSKLDDGSTDGTLWMTQNLRIQGTISADLSNFDGPDFNVSEYDLKIDDSCSGNSNPCSHLPEVSEIPAGDTLEQIGAWYNYAATSAGTITGGFNGNTATSDICPSNWHLPIYNSNKVTGSINSIADSATLRDPFRPTTGGYYNIGSSPSDTTNGYWWSTHAVSGYYRYRLYGNTDSISTNGATTGSGFMSNGLYIRCVHTAN